MRGSLFLSIADDVSLQSAAFQANDDAMDVSQLWTPSGQTSLTAENFLQLQASDATNFDVLPLIYSLQDT